MDKEMQKKALLKIEKLKTILVNTPGSVNATRLRKVYKPKPDNSDNIIKRHLKLKALQFERLINLHNKDENEQMDLTMVIIS